MVIPVPEFRPEDPVIRGKTGHFLPESRRMIEMAQMAELVENDIVPFFRREEGDPIMKGEVTIPRTAPETRPLIAYRDAPIAKSVSQGELTHP